MPVIATSNEGWGDDVSGQIGVGGGGVRVAPVRVGEGWVTVSAGHQHACAIRDDGSAWCWGLNQSGQVEEGAPEVPVPVRIGEEVDWEQVSAGDPQYLDIEGHRVPYSVFSNEPEVTDKPEELGKALEDVFGRLWSLLKKA